MQPERKIVIYPENMIKKSLMSQNKKRFILAYLLKGNKLFKSDFFEYLLFNNPEQSTILNQLSTTYSIFKGKNCIWYGKNSPRAELGVSQFCYFAEKFEDLEVFIRENLEKSTKFEVYCRFQDFYCQKLGEILKDIAIMRLYDFSKNYSFKNRTFPNLTLITAENKTKINKKRFNIFWILSGQNIQQARKDFLKIYEEIIKRQNCEQTQEEFFKQYSSQTISLFSNFQKQIFYYTKDTIYHKMINIALRSLNFPEDIGYFRFPILRLFCAIAKLFQEQAGLPKRVQGFTCYRGCFLAEEQYNTLKNNIGQAIQMDGFLSTSESKQYVLGTFGSYIIVINVPPIKTTKNLFSCFAFIQKYSRYDSQQQVLFTPLNTFVVKNAYEIENIKYIELDFVYFDEIQELNLPKEFKESLLQNFHYQMSMLTENNDQSQTLFRIRRQTDKRVVNGYKEKIRKGLQKSLKKNTQNIPCILGETVTKKLLKLFKKYLPLTHFNWPASYSQSLKLVNNYIYDNITCQRQIFYFFAQAIGTYELAEQESNFFFFMLVGRNNMEIQHIVANLARNSEHLHFYEQSTAFYGFCFQFFQITNDRFQVKNVIFLIGPFIFSLKMGYSQIVSKYKELVIKILKRSIDTQGTLPIWIELLENFEDLKFMRNFKIFYEKTYRPAVYFIVQLFFQAFQRYERRRLSTLQIDNPTQTIELVESCMIQFSTLTQKNFLLCEKAIAAKILLKYPNKIQTCMQYISEFQQSLKQIRFQSYVSFHSLIIGLKYLSECYKILGQINTKSDKWKIVLNSVYSCLKFVLDNYKYHSYAHFMILLTICEICSILGWDKFFRVMFKNLLYFMRKLKLVRKEERFRYEQIQKFAKQIFKR